MKARGLAMALACAALLASLPSSRAEAAVTVSISYFHDRLAPYGEWVTVPRYGVCWRPVAMGSGWQPYLDGEWIWTDEGWVWVSYDPWGGDPYHYGAWVDLADWGWCWIPGTIWAPAWVTWYIGPDVCGWAPVSPALSVGTRGYAGGAVTVAASAYVFVPTRSFAGGNARNARLARSDNTTYIARSRPSTRFEVSRGGVLTAGGPAVAVVARASGREIPRVDVSRAKTVPVPLSRAARGGRAAVVASPEERARVIAVRAPAVKAPERAPERAREGRAAAEASPARPPRETRREARPPERLPNAGREAAPRREPPSREASPREPASREPARREPPPRRESPARREAPPERAAAPPPPVERAPRAAPPPPRPREAPPAEAPQHRADAPSRPAPPSRDAAPRGHERPRKEHED